MTSVLVTGGAGFIGSNLVDALVSSGADVTVLDDLSSGDVSNVDDGVRFIEGSVADRGTVDDAMAGCDVVFHLAASVGNRRSLRDPLSDATINHLGTLTVLEAMRSHNVPKIVYSSSAGVFGELKTLPIDEDHPLDPDSPYGVSKLAGERAVIAYSKLYDLDGVALRYFNVYGPNQRFDEYGNVIPIFVFRMLAGDPVTVYGDGEQTRDFINVTDVVRANLAAAGASGVSGVFNIASGSSVTINDLAARIGGLVGGEPVVSHGPPRPGDVRHSLGDIARARSLLGFDPQVELDPGLSEYVAWARAEVEAT